MLRTLLATLLATLCGADALADPPRLPAGVTPESLAEPEEAARVAGLLEAKYPAPRSEAAAMLIAILRGSTLSPGDGWFGPAESRYHWQWLAKRHGVDAKSGAVARAKFAGPAPLFDLLDRDGDGAVTPGDLDWSERSPYVMQANLYSRAFRRLDASGDGKLSREEFDKFFGQLSGGKGHFTADDLRGALIPRGNGGFTAGDAPTVPVLVKGLFAGEIGSMGEGPDVNDAAPDFTLPSADGTGPVTLSKLTGAKPVVLVFGNFTCGPFRGLFPDVEAVYRRHKGRATFVMVYVREAHPTDGWKMDSNGKVGVALKQPTTAGERGEACALFRKKLNPEMTVLVDDISDPAGTAYSGMPARLYVIDAKGKVAYKGGRGPFGFKPGEMEQALVMALVDAAPAKASAEPKSSGRE